MLRIKTVVLLLLLGLYASSAFGAVCSESPTGQQNCETLVGRDQSSANRANFVAIRPNDSLLTTDPTCANATVWSGLAQGFVPGIDANESGAHVWTFCDIGLGAAGSFTAGTVTALGLIGNNDLQGVTYLKAQPRIWVAMDGVVPSTQVAGSGDALEVSNSSGRVGMQVLVGSDTSTHDPYFRFTRARGTSDAPTLVQNGDAIGTIAFQGTDGGAERSVADIRVEVDGTASTGIVPGRMLFDVTDTSAVSQSRLRLKATGHIILTPGAAGDAGIGAAIGYAPMHISMDGTVPGTLFYNTGTLMITTNEAAGAKFSLSTASTTGSGSINFTRTRGTIASPLVAVDGDTLGIIAFGGADSASSRRAFAQIEGFADGTIAAGNVPGRLVFSTVSTGSSTMVERLRVTANGNVVLGTAALATTATDGFLYLPTCAGAPTGNSADYTGRLPMVYDSTNNKLCFNTTGTTWLCTAALS